MPILRHASFLLLAIAARLSAAAQPNVVVILADDLGYGDLACYGSKIPTPHCDRLAKEGTRFLDFHTTSSVCTPTRYSLLTGRYNWRTRLQEGVLYGGSHPLIAESRQTLGHLFRSAGYRTACIGKWHLGLGWQGSEIPDAASAKGDVTKLALTEPIAHGPIARGFDRFFGITASLDMPPFAYIDQDKLLGQLTEKRTYVREGIAAAGFDGSRCLEDFARESRKFFAEKSAQEKPFFLYLPLTSPHTPILPTARFAGKSPYGEYGDFVMETDWAVGQILQALDELKLSENTLVLFTSDNGASPAAKLEALEKLGHRANGNLRGMKADLWEGGHRVPCLVRWPGQVPAGKTSGLLSCVADLYATFAEVLSVPQKAEDSHSLVAGWKQDAPQAYAARQQLVSHSIQGHFALRDGDWKLLLHPGSGGWSNKKITLQSVVSKDPLELVQLYNLAEDPAEQRNLAKAQPDKVRGLLTQLAQTLQQHPNDVPVKLPPRLLAAFPELQAKID
jgi:arylsulfatase A